MDGGPLYTSSSSSPLRVQPRRIDRRRAESSGRARDQKNQTKRYRLAREIAVKNTLRKQRAKPDAERVPPPRMKTRSIRFLHSQSIARAHRRVMLDA